MVGKPIDWEEIKLGKIFDVLAGGDLKETYFSEFYSDKNSYEIFSNGIENRGHYGYTSKAIYPGNSLTVSARGTIGQAYYRAEEFDAIIRLLVLIPQKRNVNPKFYEYFINSQIEFNIESTGVPQLTAPKIKEILVLFPNLTEQNAIVEILEDFDEHIDNLIELIEKKKAIREGVLEELMSGKSRVDGFDDQWISMAFHKYFSFVPNNTFSREFLSNLGEIGNIHYGDVLVKYDVILSKSDDIPKLIDKSNVTEKQYLKKNDVIIADTAEDETVGKAVQVGDIDIPLVSGLHTYACRPNYQTADSFLGYYINSKSYHDQLLPLITGTKVSSVSKKSIRQTEIIIPMDIKEQEAIASVLTTLDEEIKVLESEKDKLIQIKEGAMDDLLTGRVRLKQ